MAILYAPQRKIWMDSLMELEPQYEKTEYHQHLPPLLFLHLLYNQKDQKTLPNRIKRYEILKLLLTYCKNRFDS